MHDGETVALDWLLTSDGMEYLSVHNFFHSCGESTCSYEIGVYSALLSYLCILLIFLQFTVWWLLRST